MDGGGCLYCMRGTGAVSSVPKVDGGVHPQHSHPVTNKKVWIGLFENALIIAAQICCLEKPPCAYQQDL